MLLLYKEKNFVKQPGADLGKYVGNFNIFCLFFFISFFSNLLVEIEFFSTYFLKGVVPALPASQKIRDCQQSNKLTF